MNQLRNIREFLDQSGLQPITASSAERANLNLLYPENTAYSSRLQSLLTKQGARYFDFSQLMSSCMKLVDLVDYGQRLEGYLLAPVYLHDAKLFTTFTIPVSLATRPDLLWQKSKGREIFLRLSLEEFKKPVTENCRFWLHEFEVLDNLLINPWDYCDRRAIERYVVPGGQRPELTSNRLISLLSGLCRFLTIEDLNLLRAILAREGVLKKFLSQPASIAHHHSFKHGLLLHTVETCFHALQLVRDNPVDVQYSLTYSCHGVNPLSGLAGTPSLNKFISLTILCSILHDLGKAEEYEDLGNGGYTLTQKGNLLGHVNTVASWISVAAHETSYPCQNALNQILHCITAVNKEYDQSGLRYRKTLLAKMVKEADRISATRYPKSPDGIDFEPSSIVVGG